MAKRLLTYVILIFLYIFLPGIVQKIFMEYDEYYDYIITTLLFIVNSLFAFNFLKLCNKLSNLIAAVIVTLIGILSALIIIIDLYLRWEGIIVALLSNAISSIFAGEIIFQFNRKKTAANSGFKQ